MRPLVIDSFAGDSIQLFQGPLLLAEFTRGNAFVWGPSKECLVGCGPVPSHAQEAYSAPVHDYADSWRALVTAQAQLKAQNEQLTLQCTKARDLPPRYNDNDPNLHFVPPVKSFVESNLGKIIGPGRDNYFVRSARRGRGTGHIFNAAVIRWCAGRLLNGAEHNGMPEASI